jgi:hypothetical protein
LVGYVGRNLPNGRTSAEEILKNSSHLGDGTFLVRSHVVSRIKNYNSLLDFTKGAGSGTIVKKFFSAYDEKNRNDLIVYK